MPYSTLVITAGISAFAPRNEIGSRLRGEGSPLVFPEKKQNPEAHDPDADPDQLTKSCLAFLAIHRARQSREFDPEAISAEFSMLHAIREARKLSSGAVVHLIHTPTLGGHLAVELQKSIIEENLNVQVHPHPLAVPFDPSRPGGLALASGAFIGSVSRLLAAMDPRTTAFAPIGGYKVMVALGHTAASFHGFPSLYLHEDSQILQEIAPAPIAITAETRARLAPVARRIGTGAEWESLSVHERSSVISQPTFFTRIDDLVGLNELGQFFDPEAFFSVSLARDLKPGKVISLQTAGASAVHGEAFARRLGDLGFQNLPVLIPEGRTEVELWQIFAALTAAVPENSTLHLDITHGFRSLPVLGFIALNYLRITRNVSIGGVHYGAFEAIEDGIAPAFDLTPFLTLLNWTAAADQFLATGSAVRLADLLRNTQQSLWQNTGGDQPADLPKTLTSLGRSLENSSNGLLLLRTAHLVEDAAKLRRQMGAAEAELKVHASPFLEVLEPVRQELTRFCDTDLSTLRELICWLVQKSQTNQALTLASEWLVSYVMALLDKTSPKATHDTRDPFAKALWMIEHPDNRGAADHMEACLHHDDLRRCLPAEGLKKLGNLSSRIRAARNDLNHAGFNENPAKASDLILRAEAIADEIMGLSLP